MRRRSRRRSFAVINVEKRKFLMRKHRITIGRTGNATGSSDIEAGSFSVISRRHLELLYDTGRLYLRCMGKNGIFINGDFKENENILYRLPKRCILRFPSTNLHLSIFVPAIAAFKSVGYTRKHPLRTIQRRFSFNPMPLDDGADRSRSPDLQNSFVASPGGSPKLVDEDCVSHCVNITYSGCSRRKQQLIPVPHSVTHVKGNFLSNEASQMQQEAFAKSPAQNPIDSAAKNPESASVSISCVDVGVGNSNKSFIWDMSLPVNKSCLNVMALDSNMSAFSISTAKPAYSFAQLIVQALSSQTHRRLTLAGIYSFISQNYPYYRLSDKGWQNSIRHNLSLSKYFFKAPRNLDEPGKGCFWRMDPQYEDRLISQAFKLRRPRVNGETIPEFVTYLSLPSAVPAGHLTFSLVQPTAVVQSWSSVRLRGSHLIQPSPQPIQTFLAPNSFSADGAANSLSTEKFSESADRLLISNAVGSIGPRVDLTSRSIQTTSRNILNTAQKIFLVKNRISSSCNANTRKFV